MMSGSLDLFRTETRNWLERNCPPEMRRPPLEQERCWGGRRWVFSSDAQRVWLERMAERGWTAPGWPSEYGGGGLDRDEVAVLKEEMGLLRCRPPLESFGLWMLGPVLLKFGTVAQKRQHIAPIVRGEIRWCQGYSEPEAGSDLASLRTRAEKAGDCFIVSGQKIWTSHAHNSDWIFCLVRSDPTASRHAGISFLLFDMETPGITTRPITMISGLSNFCEVFFDQVSVPRDNLVGEAGQGWTIAKYLLTQERGSISELKPLNADGTLGRLAADALGRTPEGALDQATLRARIAAYEADAIAFEWMAKHFADLDSKGQLLPTASSILKYASSELNKLRHDLRMSSGGSGFLEWQSEVSREGHEARGWLRSMGNSIEGGTTEIQLNIIAKHALGLPGA